MSLLLVIVLYKANTSLLFLTIYQLDHMGIGPESDIILKQYS